MVGRIGAWIKHHRRGIDIARLFVAFVEAEEIKANLTITRFMTALEFSFPEVRIVGTRQVQKDVNVLQNLLPHGKRYGKDEPEKSVRHQQYKDRSLAEKS